MLTIKDIYDILVDNPLQELIEKMIVIGKGANYGQVVFLAGGGGSGKGFASTHMLDSNKFKVRDVDEWKRLFLKIDALKKKYPEIRGLDLRVPENVFKLHQFVDKLDVKDNTLKLLLSTLVPGRYPNVLFDITAKDPLSLFKQANNLIDAGYEAKNMNIVWVLTNYEIAATRNKNRSRVVPSDVLRDTHVGAARTMSAILFDNKLDRSKIDGNVFVVLNNESATKFYSGNKVLKNFDYIKAKEVGKPVKIDDRDMLKLTSWIEDNIPKDEK